MKELQNNFTTPEQSKRLLELGVPANSADCVWSNPYYDGDRPELAEIYIWKGKYSIRVDKYTLPCWSVGRLMEIFDICCEDRLSDDWREFAVISPYSYIDYIIRRFEDNIMNFSKLEE